MLNKRRQFLYAAGLSGLGLAGYSYTRGVRLPTLHWDPSTISSEFDIPTLKSARGSDLIQTSNTTSLDARFRAYAPEPSLRLFSESKQLIAIIVTNIASDAELQTSNGVANVSEEINGIQRTLVIEFKANQTIELSWKLPALGSYTFASIGDTGGDKELAWCLQRAHALGARFLLHLGDFNYQAGDYQRSIDLFDNSPVPVYVAIGNHDFHDGGAIYDNFLNEIGPLNNAFTIGKTRYANIDTAANFLPYSAGQRGALFKQMIQQTGFGDTVAFTHRPLHDPMPEANTEHDIGSIGERDWLIESLKQVGAKSLLSGHIHIYHRSDFDGIDNIIAGQGLGHQDLIVGKGYSKMVIGQVDTDGSVSYTTAELAMPMALHCHPRTDVVKKSLIGGPNQELLDRVAAACKQAT